MMPQSDVDLVVDLNNEYELGLPWTFLDVARDPALIREGEWIVVGDGSARAIAQVVEIDGDIVRVRPLPEPSMAAVTPSRRGVAGREQAAGWTMDYLSR